MDGRERMVLTQRDARQHEPGADSQPTDLRARQLHADASDLGTDVRRLKAPVCTPRRWPEMVLVLWVDGCEPARACLPGADTRHRARLLSWSLISLIVCEPLGT